MHYIIAETQVAKIKLANLPGKLTIIKLYYNFATFYWLMLKYLQSTISKTMLITIGKEREGNTLHLLYHIDAILLEHTTGPLHLRGVCLNY